MIALGRIGDYYELSKPRIIALLLVTTAAAMVMAARGVPPLGLLFWTLLAGRSRRHRPAHSTASGTRTSTASCSAPNRARSRKGASLDAARRSMQILAGGISFALFYVFVNPLAAWLSLAGNAYYVVIYTMWLKRITPLNIVIGGAAGAVPPLVGWAAVTHAIGAPALGLFALIFLWTPPHFWSLALMTEIDYGKANIPMLPNVYGESAQSAKSCTTASYSLRRRSCSIRFTSWVRSISAPRRCSAGSFVLDACRTWREQTGTREARKLFRYSLMYLALMCAVMVIDRIVS